ncbi:MAG: hypothetical protein H6Q00_3276 [Holophagaceae bacterium]|nr:hypothetical protein [Holophagaceae bacterium]
MRRFWQFLFLIPLALLMSGCSGSSGGGGGVNVKLVDAPTRDYQEINVHILAVDIHTSSGWVTLGSPDLTVNLLSLTGGLTQTLVSGASLPEGQYEQMRLLLGTGNTVRLSDGSLQELKVPSGLQTGIKLPLSFTVAAGTTKDIFIDFDGAHSVQVTHAGGSGQYLLRPTVRAYDQVVTGSISGTLTDSGSAAALGGATVLAETLDGGVPTLVRSTLTDTAGAYVLDLLPVGATYYVVSMPRVGSPVQAYDPLASGGMALSPSSPLFTYSAAFTASSAVGAIAGGITPVVASDQSDIVWLRRLLAVPSASTQLFIVDSAMATVDSSSESYGFTSLPLGDYSLLGVRTTWLSGGDSSTADSGAVDATVTADTTTTADLVF